MLGLSLMVRWFTARKRSVVSAIRGLSPERAVLLITVALVLGTFPIMWAPTVLCLAAALCLRLNAAALQVLNTLSSPLQLALLFPLERVGSRLCGGLACGGGSFGERLALSALHAVTGWACICIPAGVLLYAVLTVAMRLRQRYSLHPAQ